MTSTPDTEAASTVPQLNPTDNFLVSQEDNGSRVNRKVSYEVLLDNVGAKIARQKINGTAQSGYTGYVMPNETMVYNNITGEIGVDFDTSGFEFAGNMTKDGADDAPNSKPIAPPSDSKVGDFYLVVESKVNLEGANWGLIDVALEIADGGSDYQANHGVITSGGFTNPLLSNKIVLDYTIVDGLLIDVAYDIAKNPLGDWSGFNEGLSYTPDFSDISAGYKIAPIIVYKGEESGEPVFTVASAGSQCLVGPSATVDDSILTNLKVVPEASNIDEVPVTIDVKLDAAGAIKEITRSDYKFGYIIGTKLQILGHPIDVFDPLFTGSYGNLEVSTAVADGKVPTAVNDKLILSKSGWVLLPDAVARTAVMDVVNAVWPPGSIDADGTDISGQNTTPALKIDEETRVDNEDPYIVTLSISNATELEDGLLPKELYEKLNDLQGDFGRIDQINPVKLQTAEQKIAGSADDGLYENITIDEYEILDALGDPLPLEDIAGINIGITSAQYSVGGVIGGDNYPAGRVEGTVYIATDDEIENKADFTQDPYYNCVPNVGQLTTNYNVSDAVPYTSADNLVSRVKISGDNSYKSGESILLTALIESTNGGYSPTTVEWYLNGAQIVDGDVNDMVLELNDLSGLTPNAVNELEVNIENDTNKEIHYVYYQS